MTMRLPDGYIVWNEYLDTSNRIPMEIKITGYWIETYDEYLDARDDRRAWLIRHGKWWKKHWNKQQK